MKLIINPEYDKLVPNLSKVDYDNLKKSIQENGLWIPILCNPEGVILDGHNRYDICQELGITTKHAVREFENKLLEKKFVIECNLHRRHLNDFQKSELGIPLQKINEEIAKQNQGKRTDLTSSSNEEKVKPFHAGKETAQDIGVSKSTFERAKVIIQKAPEDLKNDVRSGKIPINKAYTIIIKQEKREKKHEEIKKIQVNLPETITLYNQEFQTAPVPKGSVSLIFTDPPYGEESLHLVRDLCFHAMKVLKDGGSLVFYPGHAHIDKVFEFAKESGLQYHWIMAVLHSGPSSSIFGARTLAAYKPLLWFTKGKYEGEFVKDVIKSEFQGKELHEWAQSTVESDYYIKYMTIQNEIVYDPFLGSGVFGISAKKLKRQFIGCEINPDHFETARRMISQ